MTLAPDSVPPSLNVQVGVPTADHSSDAVTASPTGSPASWVPLMAMSESVGGAAS